MSDLAAIAGPYRGKEKRTTKRKQPDGTFADIEFRELKKGDEFVLFEEDGVPVERDPHGFYLGKVFKALSDAEPPSLGEVLSPEAPWAIQVEYPD